MRSEPSGYFSKVVSHPLIHIQYMHEVNGVAQLGSSPPVHAGIWHEQSPQPSGIWPANSRILPAVMTSRALLGLKLPAAFFSCLFA